MVQELPLLFLKGGAIVPTGPVVQHVGEAKLTDTITLLVALDEEGKFSIKFKVSQIFQRFTFSSGAYLCFNNVSNVSYKMPPIVNLTGKAEGILYEDDGDSFSFASGDYLLTTYEAQQSPSKNGTDGGEVVVKVARSEGNWTRPERKLHVRLLLGNTTEVLEFKHGMFHDC